MKQCERCLKHTDGIHTCKPTDFVRKLEAELDKYRKALENLGFLDAVNKDIP